MAEQADCFTGMKGMKGMMQEIPLLETADATGPQASLPARGSAARGTLRAHLVRKDSSDPKIFKRRVHKSLLPRGFQTQASAARSAENLR